MTILPAIIAALSVAVFISACDFVLAGYGWHLNLEPVTAGMLVATGWLFRESWEVVR